MHGGVRDVQLYMRTTTLVSANAALLRADFPSARLCFFGHSHFQKVYEVDGTDCVRELPLEASLSRERLYFINMGSVDAQRKHASKLAECALFDSGAWSVEFLRLPYDAAAPIPVQVEQSFASSLEHLGVATIDSYLLHGPTGQAGLAPADWAAWRAMEAIHDSGKARMLGVCNVTLEQLEKLCQEARVRPRFVQNRCYAVRGWDRRVRDFCTANGLVYQGFSLLTANREVLARPELARIAKRHGRAVSQIVFRFALDAGMMPLTGTTDVDHMRADLDVFNFRLEREEVERIESLAAP